MYHLDDRPIVIINKETRSPLYQYMWKKFKKKKKRVNFSVHVFILTKLNKYLSQYNTNQMIELEM